MPRNASPDAQAAEPSKPKSTEHLGKTLKRYRKLRELTQESLAKEAGISRTGFALIERGDERNVRLTTLELLAKALAVDIIDLLVEPTTETDVIVAVEGDEKRLRAAPERLPCLQEYFIRAACNIARYRKLAGLTQEELSALAHRYRTFVASLEQLHALPTIVGLEALTGPLKVSVVDLLMPVSDEEYEERRARLPRSRRLKEAEKRAQKRRDSENSGS